LDDQGKPWYAIKEKRGVSNPFITKKEKKKEKKGIV